MRYLAKRGGLFLITLWAALTVNFAIPRLMPGNEAEAVLATFRGSQSGSRCTRSTSSSASTSIRALISSYLAVPRELPDRQFRDHRSGRSGEDRDHFERCPGRSGWSA